jgi:hypothetical protein
MDLRIPKPTLGDLKYVLGPLVELVFIMVLFIAALANGDFWSITVLNIFVSVGALLLILADAYFMLRARACRAVPLTLLMLDAGVLLFSIILLYLWMEYQNGHLLPSSYSQQVTMDALLLVLSLFIFLARVELRAYDRENNVTEGAGMDGVLMRTEH